VRRREFIACGTAAAVWPLAADAQQPGKVFRVGIIFSTSPLEVMVGPEPSHPHLRALLHELRRLGYVEGQNFALERRSAAGRVERFGDIVAELVEGKVDALVTVNDDMTQAARRVTQTVPIVMVASWDPIAAGFAVSLARPSGNVTGFTTQAGPEIRAKQLQLIKELVPRMTRVAFLGMASDWESDEGKAVRAAARNLNVTLLHAQHSPLNYVDAFSFIARERPNALYISRNAANFAQRQLIAEFAAEHRIPSQSGGREHPEAGGLISYGLDLRDNYRRAAGYIDKIFRGAKPADLPIEQPTKFELVINLRTARALGLTVPPSLLARADEVIE
jgi:putative tryptophan/tyrosine transport system substrate-binding protein